jgi:transcriptional regulator with XRE-family HTH domain
VKRLLRLKSLRQLYGYSREELADRLGISVFTLRSWEQGKREPSLSMIIKISNIFNCSIDHLVGNDK